MLRFLDRWIKPENPLPVQFNIRERHACQQIKLRPIKDLPVCFVSPVQQIDEVNTRSLSNFDCAAEKAESAEVRVWIDLVGNALETRITNPLLKFCQGKVHLNDFWTFRQHWACRTRRQHLTYTLLHISDRCTEVTVHKLNGLVLGVASEVCDFKLNRYQARRQYLHGHLVIFAKWDAIHFLTGIASKVIHFKITLSNRPTPLNSTSNRVKSSCGTIAVTRLTPDASTPPGSCAPKVIAIRSPIP